MRTIFALLLLAGCSPPDDAYFAQCVATDPTCAQELVFCSDGSWKMRYDGHVSIGTYEVDSDSNAVAESNARDLGFTFSFSTQRIVSGYQQGTHWPATIPIQDGDVTCAE